MAAPGPVPTGRRGVLAGFANSADLGGVPLPHDRRVPSGRLIRSDTPEHLTAGELATARSVGFTAVVDLRSRDELQACPHPLAELPGYRWLPLIDPAAEARADLSRYRTLGEIYSSSLQRNATHIAAIFTALAEVSRGPVLVACRAGRDRTGMVVALLLDLAGVHHDAIAADYAAGPHAARAPAPSRRTRPIGGDIRQMLDHVSATYGSTAGYLRGLGLEETGIAALRRLLEP